MMPYLENRNPKIDELHSVYSNEIPEYLLSLLDLPELTRLNGIDVNSGIHLSGFHMYHYSYSELDHSLGMALILHHFVTNKTQELAALFHDIAVPAFSYATTYIAEENFEKDELPLKNYDVLVGSDKLFEFIFKNDVKIDDLCDYTVYPLAYNVRPFLCAHSLEYFLHTAYMSNLCSLKELQEIYDDLVIVPNEDNMPEFAFGTPVIAEKFTLLALECGKKYRSYESKATMKFISDTLAPMLRRRVIKRRDLYTSTDKTIMDIGLNCTDKRISDRWNYLPNLNKVYTKFNQVENKYCTKIGRDLRYVDPLVAAKVGYKRISQLDEEMNYKINEFLNSDTDLYMYIDYED